MRHKNVGIAAIGAINGKKACNLEMYRDSNGRLLSSCEIEIENLTV